MRHSTLFLVATLALVATAEAPAAAEPPISAVDAFAHYCYEPNRLGGRSMEPPEEHGWQTVSGELRQEFNLPDDPAVRAWVRVNAETQDVQLLQLHERQLGKAGVHSNQYSLSCKLIVSPSAREFDTMRQQLRDLLGENEAWNTRRLDDLGFTAPEGWDQACWTILTRVDNTDWKPTRNQNRPVCIALTSSSNYIASQYVAIRLLTLDDPRTAIIQMDRFLRPDALPPE